MSYRFNFKDLCQEHLKKNKDVEHIFFPNNLGSSHDYKEHITNDISLVKHDMNINGDFEILVEDIKDDYTLDINIVLQGEENNISIEYKKQRKGLVKLSKDSYSKGLNLCIQNSFLEENLFSLLKDEKRMEIEKNTKNGIETLFKSSLVSSKTLALAREIHSSPFNGTLNKLYLQSRVYEIVHDEFLSIINEENKKPTQKIILSQYDIEALHKARILILENKKNFSISELSRKVALNEKKFKYGFKQLFHTTPGNIMLEARMYEAKKLLEASEYNVTEIAELTGYKYVQNFTNAFIKFFGQSPKDIMKSRKYYY